MSDVPDDLTSVGRHHGNDPPTETGQEVRSPEGPDPESDPADPAPALFQLLRDSDTDRIQIRVHSPRAEVPSPEEGPDELGQYRTVNALRDALDEASIGGRTAVFEDAQTGKMLTDSDVSSDHAWIGQPRYEVVTFFPDQESANEYMYDSDSSSNAS